MGMHMTYEECLVTRQVLDQDRRFIGTVFSRKQWSTDHYSVSLQLRDGQELEFGALKDFQNWHARYPINRRPRRRTSAMPGGPCSSGFGSDLSTFKAR